MTAKEISAMKFITNIAGIVLIFSLTPAIAAEPCETLCGLTFYQTASAASVLNLLADGADVNAKDAQGKSPLHYVAGASPEVIAALLSAGADVMAKDTLVSNLIAFRLRNRFAGKYHDIAERCWKSPKARLSCAAGSCINNNL
jgi:hypothetical protein